MTLVPFGQEVAEEFGVAHGAPHRPLHGGHQPDRLVHDEVERLQLLERLDVQRTVAQPVGFVAATVLPLGVGRQVVGHGGGGRGRGVVRGHHQEDHVVDDVVVGEPVSVLVFGVAQHREQVGSFVAAALSHPRLEVVLQQLAGFETAPPRERRHAGADDRVACAHWSW